MRAVRHTRQLPRADMTPLVNIALLLIVFFVWVKQVQRPVMVAPHLVDEGDFDYYEPVSATLFLLKENKVGFLYYHPNKSTADYQEIDYSVSRLRALLASPNFTDRAVVLIVPTAQSTIKNLVDIIDEFTINKRINFVMRYEMWPEANQMISDYHQCRPNNLTSLTHHVSDRANTTHKLQ